LRCRAKKTEALAPYWAKWEHLVGFLDRFYKGLPAYQLTEERPWSLIELPDLKLVVACMNSTMRESHQDGDHYGWLGENQLTWFAREMQPYKEKKWLRIGLMHHNPIRGAVKDNANLRDVDDLERILGDEINLLLHGHTHQGRLTRLGCGLPVLSTGSAGVKGEARPGEVPNQYQIIRIRQDSVWYGGRCFAPEQKRWIGDNRVGKSGNCWYNEEKVEFQDAGETFGVPAEEEEEAHQARPRRQPSRRSALTAPRPRQSMPPCRLPGSRPSCECPSTWRSSMCRCTPWLICAG
jgi:hypothetical protein